MSTILLVETTFHLGSISLFLVGSPENIAAYNWGKISVLQSAALGQNGFSPCE